MPCNRWGKLDGFRCEHTDLDWVVGLACMANWSLVIIVAGNTAEVETHRDRNTTRSHLLLLPWTRQSAHKTEIAVKRAVFTWVNLRTPSVCLWATSIVYSLGQATLTRIHIHLAQCPHRNLVAGCVEQSWVVAVVVVGARSIDEHKGKRERLSGSCDPD